MSSLFLYWGVHVPVLSELKCESYESQFRRFLMLKWHEPIERLFQLYMKSWDSMYILLLALYRSLPLHVVSWMCYWARGRSLHVSS